MNISGLSTPNWFQKLELELISAFTPVDASTTDPAGTAASTSANGADPTDSTASSTSVAAPTPSTSLFAPDMMATLIAAQSQGSLADQASASLIGTLDNDRDGSLSLAEVQRALSGGGQADTTTTSSTTSPVDKAFAKLDANGDGELSASELSSAMQTLEQTASEMIGRRHHHHHHDTQTAATDATTPATPATAVSDASATTSETTTSSGEGSAAA